MHSTQVLQTLAAALAIFSNTAAAIPRVSAVGSKYFTDDGKQWFVKGVAYQLSPDDPLVNDRQCEIDARLMKDLGANAIRVYHVDPDQHHDKCMKILADNGIYLFLDLDTFDTAINQDEPAWTERQYAAFAKVMDAFANYDNMAGFFVGNEVINTPVGAKAAPYILAAVADMKKYRDSQNYHKIPIGYSAADIAELRPMLQNYLACHKDQAERVDFFALNSYEWCGENTFHGSGYGLLQKQAEGYPVPIWFSEIGCNAVRPRTFQDLNSILGSDMNEVWSGGMAYEWIQEANDYGIVYYATPPHPDCVVTPTPIVPDFNNLQSRFVTLNPTGIALSDYEKQTATISLPACPTPSADWALDPYVPLPTIGAGVNEPSVVEEIVSTAPTASTALPTSTLTSVLNKINASPNSFTTSASKATSVYPPIADPVTESEAPTEYDQPAGVEDVENLANLEFDGVSFLITLAIGFGFLAAMI